jgi:hypothetical protein
VVGDAMKSVGKVGPVDGMTAAEEVHVAEVASARVDCSTSDGGEDLLGVHHHEGIAAEDNIAAEEPRQVHFLRGWSDRVADVDVDMEVQAGSRQIGPQRHAHAAVGVLIADHRGRRAIDVEDDTIVELVSGDLTDSFPDVLCVVVERQGLQVDVSGRSALAECAEEYAAFQNELIGKSRLSEASKEAFQGVQLQELVDRAAVASGLVPEIEVCATGLACPGGSRHSRTSSARRSAGSARGN